MWSAFRVRLRWAWRSWVPSYSWSEAIAGEMVTGISYMPPGTEPTDVSQVCCSQY